MRINIHGEEGLELRMYFFVPYNISPIQKAIQAGHASLEYARIYGDQEQFKEFVDNWKTWIILNGGTTNERRDFNGIAQGTLNQIGDELHENGITFSYFQEPDLNNALTALCFIADERVFNRKEYPNFVDFVIEKRFVVDIEAQERHKKLSASELKGLYHEEHKEWVRLLGGVKNEFLRELIDGKKLA